MIKLFIYIPTYNRPQAIRKQLEVLYPQIIKHDKHVRVLINDNGTPEGKNDNLLDDFKAQNIELRKNPGNIGICANIALGFVFAKDDEHLWILSDNDIIKPDALDYLFAEIDDINTYFVVPFKAHNENFYPVNYEKDKIVTYKWDDNLWHCSCSDKNFMWFGIGIDNIIAISHGIYSVKQIKQSLSESFKYHNTILPHTAVILGTIKQNSEVTFKLFNKCIFDDYVTSKENLTDYTFLASAKPQLINLLPKINAKDYALRWIKNSADALYFTQFYNKEEYFNTALSRRLLIKKGGFQAYLLLVYIKSKFLIRTAFKEFFNFILPQKYFNAIKKLRAKFIGFFKKDYQHPMTENEL